MIRFILYEGFSIIAKGERTTNPFIKCGGTAVLFSIIIITVRMIFIHLHEENWFLEMRSTNGKLYLQTNHIITKSSKFSSSPFGF